MSSIDLTLTYFGPVTWWSVAWHLWSATKGSPSEVASGEMVLYLGLDKACVLAPQSNEETHQAETIHIQSLRK